MGGWDTTHLPTTHHLPTSPTFIPHAHTTTTHTPTFPPCADLPALHATTTPTTPAYSHALPRTHYTTHCYTPFIPTEHFHPHTTHIPTPHYNAASSACRPAIAFSCSSGVHGHGARLPAATCLATASGRMPPAIPHIKRLHVEGGQTCGGRRHLPNLPAKAAGKKCRLCSCCLGM